MNDPSNIVQPGYIIELAEGGPWLKNDLTWTPCWNERGLWMERPDAEMAALQSMFSIPPDNSP